MLFCLKLDDRYKGTTESGAFEQQQPMLQAMHVDGARSITWLTALPILFLVMAVLPAAFLDCVLLPAWRRQRIKARKDGLASVKAYTAHRQTMKTLPVVPPQVTNPKRERGLLPNTSTRVMPAAESTDQADGREDDETIAIPSMTPIEMAH